MILLIEFLISALLTPIQFIKLLTGVEDDSSIGHSLESHTRDVSISQPVQLNGHSVRLIDTPGFDDSHFSGAEILARIAETLTAL